MWRVSLTETAGLGREALAEATRDRITTSAASLAFHLCLALFPALIAAVGLLELLGLSPSELGSVVHDVRVLLPAQMAQTVEGALRSQPGKLAGGLEVGVGLLVATWSAVEAMASLQVGLDVAYEVSTDRGFLRRRLMSLPLVGLTVVLGGAATALAVLGDPLRTLLPSSFAFASSTADVGWVLVRWIGALCLVTALLSSYYWLGPNLDREHRRWLSAGAFGGAAAWLGASAGFSFYLDHFGRESRTYGSFAGVAVLLLWLYLTGLVVLLGAELNCEIDRRARSRGRQVVPG
jgi:membrane protein